MVQARTMSKSDIQMNPEEVSTTCDKLSLWAMQLARSKAFDYSVACAILLNAMLIGVQADWAAKNITASHTPTAFNVFDRIFNAIFTFELTVRIFAERCFFLSIRNKNITWNLL